MVGQAVTGSNLLARKLASREGNPEQRAVSGGLPGPVEGLTVQDADAFIEHVRMALYVSRIVACSQGFDEIRAGAAEYIDKPGTFPTLWSGDRAEIEAEDTH